MQLWELENRAITLNNISTNFSSQVTVLPEDETELKLEIFTVAMHLKQRSLYYAKASEQQKEKETKEFQKTHAEAIKNLQDTAMEAMNEIDKTASPVIS
jgi:esterase/lipase